ncbi:MAG: right-handed parallel beta-helix repeat-containing protein [Planctomycetota bacterium]
MQLQSPLILCLACSVLCAEARASDLVVAASGGAFTSIQAALDVAGPGDRVLVRARPGGAPWREKVAFVRGGDAAAGFVELRNFPGEQPVIDGAGLPGPWMITIEDLSWVRVEGLRLIGNDDPQGDGSGVRVAGSGRAIQIVGNTFTGFVGASSMAITVYGTSTQASFSEVLLADNVVRNCQVAPSEAIVLSGNIEHFQVLRNTVEDVNNIGIDVIGGEASINPTFGARDGLVADNRVVRAREASASGFAAGIYLDGAERVIVERNYVAFCDQGIEVGCENLGWVSRDVVVRNNVIVANDKVGFAVGGYDLTAGRVQRARIVHNLLYGNATSVAGATEVWVNLADSTLLSGNIIVLEARSTGLLNTFATVGTRLENNVWWRAQGPIEFEWLGQLYPSLSALRSSTGLEQRGRFVDPRLTSPRGADGVLGTLDDDFRLLSNSPCIDAGDTTVLGLQVFSDAAGQPRLVDTAAVADLGLGLAPRPDQGPFERPAGLGDTARFCDSVANSTGAPGRLEPLGSTSLGANDFVLSALGVPPGAVGFFVLGGLPANNAIGAGVLCVQGAVARLPVQFSDPQGRASLPVNWLMPLGGASVGVVGSRWVATFAHRDVVAGQATFNFSDALDFTLRP